MKINNLINKKNSWVFMNNEFSQYMIFNENAELTSKTNFSKIIIIFNLGLSLIWIFLLYVYQFFIKKIKLNSYNNKIVLNSETKNSISKILEKNKIDQSFYFVDVISKKEILKIHSINIFILIKNIYNCFLDIFNIHLKYNFPKDVRHYLLKNLDRRIAMYIIFSSIINSIKKNKINVEVLSGGVFFYSYASIYFGIKTIYYAHGFAGKFYTPLYPKFNNIYIFSKEEKKILKNLNLNSKIEVYKYYPVKNYKNNIIIYSRGVDWSIEDKNGYKLFNDLLNFFIKLNYKIYVKLHPIYQGKYFLEPNNKFSIIKKKYKSNENLLHDLNPKFVISWYSSVMCESLYSNIIPINLLNEKASKSDKKIKFNREVRVIDWNLYPIMKKTLSWVKDKKLINRIYNNRKLYKETLNKLINN